MEQRINYFTNDTSDIIKEKVGVLEGGDTTCIDYNEWDKDDVFESMVKFFKKHSLKNKESNETARNLLHSIHADIEIESPENIDAFEDILDLMLADEKALKFLLKEYEDYLYNHGEIISDEIEFHREMANELLKEDGFTGNKERYIIFGYGMGWRNLDGYGGAIINSLEDMEESITKAYDYTIEVYRLVGKPYLSATVYHHDAPTGESYILLPVSRLNEALKDKDFKASYDIYKDIIDADLEETA